MKDRERIADGILQAYGKELFQSHVAFFTEELPSFERSDITIPVHQSRRLPLKRVLVICAIIILIMAAAIIICDALGIQLFHFHFDDREGYSILMSNGEPGKNYYYPEYTVEGYYLSERLNDDAFASYIYLSKDQNSTYDITECYDQEAVYYIDTENLEKSTEIYHGYELLIYNDPVNSRITVYLEMSGTFICIQGPLTMEHVHSIIDSFVIDKR